MEETPSKGAVGTGLIDIDLRAGDAFYSSQDSRISSDHKCRKQILKQIKTLVMGVVSQTQNKISHSSSQCIETNIFILALRGGAFSCKKIYNSMLMR